MTCNGPRRPKAGCAHEGRVGTALDRAELDDSGISLGNRPASRVQADDQLRAVFEGKDVSTEERDASWAGYFARRLLRLGERRRPLMASLMDRLPQPLEDK